MKKLTALALILVLLVSASGCGVRSEKGLTGPMITSERDLRKYVTPKIFRNDRDDPAYTSMTF